MFLDVFGMRQARFWLADYLFAINNITAQKVFLTVHS